MRKRVSLAIASLAFGATSIPGFNEGNNLGSMYMHNAVSSVNLLNITDAEKHSFDKKESIRRVMMDSEWKSKTPWAVKLGAEYGVRVGYKDFKY